MRSSAKKRAKQRLLPELVEGGVSKLLREGMAAFDERHRTHEREQERTSISSFLLFGEKRRLVLRKWE